MNLTANQYIRVGGRCAGFLRPALFLLAFPVLPSCGPVTATIYQVWPFDAQEAARRQDETAKTLGIHKELTLDLGKGITMKLVLIPAGKFVMGSPKEENGRDKYELQHEVTLTKPFYMGVYHVTKAQFATFIADSGYKTDADMAGWSLILDGKTWSKWDKVKGASWRAPGFEQTDEHPVVCVSHNDAKAFCDWLSRKTGKVSALPTEAEWEYACRAGTTTAYPWGDSPDGGRNWINGADQTAEKHCPTLTHIFAWDDGYVFTSPVGRFRANAFGLCDMQGNAWQLTADRLELDYYEYSPKSDPHGPLFSLFGDDQDKRGGSWECEPKLCRSANRGYDYSDKPQNTVGFRVVVEALASGNAPKPYGSPQQIIEPLRKTAEAGDSNSMVALGDKYYQWQGVPQDYEEAVKWYRKAAEAGNAKGMRRLGYMYYNGCGVPADTGGEAIKWFRKAAEAGDADSRGLVGKSYLFGCEPYVEQDYGMAMQWFRKGADAGDSRAMCTLGHMYENGMGVEHDEVEAEKWYRKAAEAGHPIGMLALGKIRYYANDVIEAMKWYRKAAEENILEAMYWLGWMYEKGSDVPHDRAEAIRWYRKAANGGDIAFNSEETLYVKNAREALERLGEK